MLLYHPVICSFLPLGRSCLILLLALVLRHPVTTTPKRAPNLAITRKFRVMYSYNATEELESA